MHTARFMTALAIAISLSACDTQPAEETAPEEVTEPAEGEAAQPEGEETVSILRPDIEQPDLPEAPLEPLQVTIGFPDGGAELDEAALEQLEAVIASDQLALGLPITLGAHSDAAGSDAANARAAEKRGLAVAEWLIDKGVNADRIDVVVFGEQNPAQPNALPDGSPNEEGRAANRRVEVTVSVPDEPAEDSA